MKKLIIAAIALLCGIGAVAAESAAQLLARCAGKLTAAPSVTARFSIRQSSGDDMAGSIVIARERFRMTSPQLHIWFDGRTQWAALAAVKEVNVTEPMADEILSTNPFAIITGYDKRYNCRLLPAADGKTSAVKQVELTPKTAAGADIRRAVISIDTRTLWPVKAVVTMASGATVNATISDCAVGKQLPVSTFTFTPSALPDYEVVDLR